MGGSSTSTQHQTQSNQINPAQMAQYQDNYAHAQTAANSLTPYTGQITAGFNPNQTQAQGILSGIATDPRYQAANTEAMGTVRGILQNPVTAQPVNASTIAGTDLTPYLNPYTNDVVNTSLADLQHARDQQQVSDNTAATAANAFGGTRQAVLNANTTNDYLRNVASTTAGLRSGAFNSALGSAATDAAARNQVGEFNAGQNLNAQQFNTNTGLAGANQLADLNNNGLQLATKQGGILSAVGDAQQQQQQRELSDAWNLYTQGQQLTLTQQQLLNQALGIIPIEQTNTTDGTTTTKSNPGAMGILGGIASLGLAAATGGSSLGLTGALGGLGGLFGRTAMGGSQNAAGSV